MKMFYHNDLSSYINGPGAGFLFLQDERTDQFVLVKPRETKNKRFTGNFVAITVEGGKLKDNRVVTEGELPRITVGVSTSFLDHKSLAFAVNPETYGDWFEVQ